MLHKSEHMAIIACTCTSNNLMTLLNLDKSICSPDLSNFIGEPPFIFRLFSLIYKDFINIHTNMSDKANSRLNCYRTMF